MVNIGHVAKHAKHVVININKVKIKEKKKPTRKRAPRKPRGPPQPPQPPFARPGGGMVINNIPPPSVITMMGKTGPIEQPRSIEESVVRPIASRLEDIVNSRMNEMMERKYDVADGKEEAVSSSSSSSSSSTSSLPASSSLRKQSYLDKNPGAPYTPQYETRDTGAQYVKNPLTTRWVRMGTPQYRILVRNGWLPPRDK